MRQRTPLILGGLAVIGLSAVMLPGLAAGSTPAALPRPGVVAAPTELQALLLGSNEVGSGDPDGVGVAAVTIDSTGQMCLTASAKDVAPLTLTHIHKGPAGVNGPVFVDFTSGISGTSVSKCVTDMAKATEILAAPAGFYVNMHNADFPGGAIRGQLGLKAPSAGTLHLLPTPLRSYDSRADAAGKLAAASTRTVSVLTGKDSVGTSQLAAPAGSTAVLVTITATETDGPGYLTAYSASLTTVPSTSNLNWITPGQTVAVSTTVAVSVDSALKLTAGPAATHVVVDVIGYYGI